MAGTPFKMKHKGSSFPFKSSPAKQNDKKGAQESFGEVVKKKKKEKKYGVEGIDYKTSDKYGNVLSTVTIKG